MVARPQQLPPTLPVRGGVPPAASTAAVRPPAAAAPAAAAVPPGPPAPAAAAPRAAARPSADVNCRGQRHIDSIGLHHHNLTLRQPRRVALGPGGGLALGWGGVQGVDFYDGDVHQRPLGVAVR